MVLYQYSTRKARKTTLRLVLSKASQIILQAFVHNFYVHFEKLLPKNTSEGRITVRNNGSWHSMWLEDMANEQLSCPSCCIKMS